MRDPEITCKKRNHEELIERQTYKINKSIIVAKSPENKLASSLLNIVFRPFPLS
jgi:hypothetical protein